MKRKIFHLAKQDSICNHFIAQMRNIETQNDRSHFRDSVERLGEIFAYEISKTFPYQTKDVQTPLGIAPVNLCEEHIIVASILRAGLSLHNGILNYLSHADSAFISAYRRHHKDGSFEINLEYITCPKLDDTIMIIADPMLATGSSFIAALDVLKGFGQPKEIHLVSVIASRDGIEQVLRMYPKVNLWIGDIDEELTAKFYIVPGLGDAGDLMYGPKLQD